MTFFASDFCVFLLLFRLFGIVCHDFHPSFFGLALGQLVRHTELTEGVHSLCLSLYVRRTKLIKGVLSLSLSVCM